ncbi:uncharacterized protein LOC121424177 [Lytechinus variegatus]|uniref:uncharacterized protein LOC121424177 n=1 Tax=Lytechinus variegatus TaxID=7654 RepID=UPI001BB12D5F|nr:uncharacterized protein LOC121424177 [Lytechinus variegatus]
MWYDGKLGVAYYNSMTAEIYTMNDTVETSDYSLLRKVCHQIQPCCVIVSSKADERLLQVLQDLGGVDSCLTGASDTLPEEISNRSIDVQLLPSLDFSLEVCKRRVLSISLPSIPEHFSESERTIYMSSLLSFDAACMVSINKQKMKKKKK